MLGPEGEVAGAPDGLAGAGVEGREGGLDPRLRQPESILKVGMEALANLARVVAPTGRAVRAPAPDLRVPGNLEQASLVPRRQRLEPDYRTFQHAREVLPHLHHLLGRQP